MELFLQNVDIIREIFCWLDAKTLCCTISRVCVEWYKIYKHDRIWDKMIQQDFHSNEETMKMTTSYENYYYICTSFSFDHNITPKEVTYSQKNGLYSIARKMSDNPDMTYVIGSRSFSSGKISWNIKIFGKGSEMRIGFTDKPNLKYTVHTLSEPHIWIWSDGGGIFTKGIWARDIGRFGLKDAVGVELDFENNRCNFYKNGVYTGTLEGLPKAPLYPLVALDAGNDLVEISMGKGIKK